MSDRDATGQFEEGRHLLVPRSAVRAHGDEHYRTMRADLFAADWSTALETVRGQLRMLEYEARQLHALVRGVALSAGATLYPEDLLEELTEAATDAG